MTNKCRPARPCSRPGGREATPETQRPAILVPLDGSRVAAGVLPLARTLATIFNAGLRVIFVTAARLPAESLKQELRLGSRGVTGLVLDQIVGDPVEAIVQEASTRGCRLVVMSTSGLTAHPERPLGHVAAELLRRAPVSLVLVPRSAARRAADPRALARILVPLDGTPATAAALAPVSELVEHSGARLVLVHVVTAHDRDLTQVGSLPVPRYIDAPQHSWQAWAREFLHRFSGLLDRPPESFVVTVGDPGTEIVRVAREQRADLLVLVWKGDLGSERAKTVQAVLRDAPCPILFLRSMGLSASSPDAPASLVREPR